MNERATISPQLFRNWDEVFTFIKQIKFRRDPVINCLIIQVIDSNTDKIIMEVPPAELCFETSDRLRSVSEGAAIAAS